MGFITIKAPFGRVCLELFLAKQANPSKTGGIPLGGSGSTLYRLYFRNCSIVLGNGGGEDKLFSSVGYMISHVSIPWRFTLYLTGILLAAHSSWNYCVPLFP